MTEIVAPWGPPAEERPPIPTIEALDAQYRAKREAREARRKERNNVPKVKLDVKAEAVGARNHHEGPSLKKRHRVVTGGPEVVGGRERVVLEREMGDR